MVEIQELIDFSPFLLPIPPFPFSTHAQIIAMASSLQITNLQNQAASSPGTPGGTMTGTSTPAHT
jgi:hypothetical protein